MTAPLAEKEEIMGVHLQNQLSILSKLDCKIAVNSSGSIISHRRGCQLVGVPFFQK